MPIFENVEVQVPLRDAALMAMSKMDRFKLHDLEQFFIAAGLDTKFAARAAKGMLLHGDAWGSFRIHLDGWQCRERNRDIGLTSRMRMLVDIKSALLLDGAGSEVNEKMSAVFGHEPRRFYEDEQASLDVMKAMFPHWPISIVQGPRGYSMVGTELLRRVPPRERKGYYGTETYRITLSDSAVFPTTAIAAAYGLTILAFWQEALDFSRRFPNQGFDFDTLLDPLDLEQGAVDEDQGQGAADTLTETETEPATDRKPVGPVITVEILHPKAVTPAYQTAGAAGADLSAVVDAPGGATDILPGDRMVINTGIRIVLPEGFEAQIRSRSGLAAKNGVFVLNSPGTIDSDYRGEIKVILFNSSRENFVVRTGDRIAQMVIAPVVQADFTPGSIEDDTARGAGGFGSTGVGPDALEPKKMVKDGANATF